MGGPSALRGPGARPAEASGYGVLVDACADDAEAEGATSTALSDQASTTTSTDGLARNAHKIRPTANSAAAAKAKAEAEAAQPRAGSRGKARAGSANGGRADVAAHWPFVDDAGTMTDILGYTRSGGGVSSDRVIPRNDYEPPAISRAIVAANTSADAYANGMAQTVPGAYGGGGGGGGGGSGGARYGFEIGDLGDGVAGGDSTDPFSLFGQLTPREQMRRVERTFRAFQVRCVRTMYCAAHARPTACPRRERAHAHHGHTTNTTNTATATATATTTTTTATEPLSEPPPLGESVRACRCAV